MGLGFFTTVGSPLIVMAVVDEALPLLLLPLLLLLLQLLVLSLRVLCPTGPPPVVLLLLLMF